MIHIFPLLGSIDRYIWIKGKKVLWDQRLL